MQYLEIIDTDLFQNWNIEILAGLNSRLSKFKS